MTPRKKLHILQIKNHMADPTKIKEAIKKEIAPGAAKCLQESKEVAGVFGQLAAKLGVALAKADEPALKLEQKVLVIQTAKMADLITRTKALLDKLEKLESDESFADDLAEVEQFTAALNTLKSNLDAEFSAGKKLEQTVATALSKHVDGEREVIEKRAVLEAWAKKQMIEWAARLASMQKIHEDVVKALHERDEDALGKALKASLDTREQAGAAYRELEDKVREFQDYIGKLNPMVLSKDLQESFAKADARLTSDASGMDVKIVEIYVHQKDSKIKPADYKKAAALLKIPATHTAKLNKALDSNRTVMGKLLDSLAKELHQHTSGKDMLAILDKEHVI